MTTFTELIKNEKQDNARFIVKARVEKAITDILSEYYNGYLKQYGSEIFAFNIQEDLGITEKLIREIINEYFDIPQKTVRVEEIPFSPDYRVVLEIDSKYLFDILKQ